jgi:hypothetical protein
MVVEPGMPLRPLNKRSPVWRLPRNKVTLELKEVAVRGELRVRQSLSIW